LMAQAQSLRAITPDLAVLIGLGVAVLVLATRIFSFDPAAAGS